MPRYPHRAAAGKPRRAIAAAIALHLLGAAAPAQTPAEAVPAAPAQRPIELVLQNLAPFPRREGASVVVPFAMGEVKDLPARHVPDTPTAWQPFGARWPDGSVRQALCLFTTGLDALSEQRVQLADGSGPPLPAGEIDLPDAKIEFVVVQDKVATRAEAVRVEDLENNALRRVELRRTRIGATGFVAELVLTAWRDQKHCAIDAAVFFSDPSTTAQTCDVDEIAIECHGMAIAFRHPGWLGIDQKATAYGSRNVLVRNDHFGDGQGLRRTGAMVPALHGDNGLADATCKAACVAPLLGATQWQASGAFGAFGYVPELPPWLRGPALRAHLALRHRIFVANDKPPGDPFGLFQHGLAKMAGQTGDQGDFGTVKMTVVAASGLPSFLLEVELSMLQEGCRPVHFFEMDASPVEPKNHRDWNVWGGRTHWHLGQSPDRLGKTDPSQPFDAHGWTGKDRQHWSDNYLGAYALLSGSHWARLELDNEVRIYLAGQTTDARHATSGAGAPRGAGRTELAASWMLLATGSEELRQRMTERIDRVYYPQWSGRDLPDDRVRTMSICTPDPRMLQGKYSYWNPWQDAIAAVGMGAAYKMTGDPLAKELAEEVAMNVVRYGWLLNDRECQVAIVMRWQDGVPLSPQQIAENDPTVVGWAYGTQFSEWSVAACEIARVAALARGDHALADRAATIQARMRQDRRPPPQDAWNFGGIDRLTEWDAVKWP
ncbi:MAG TPA: hypothetical protein VFZ65_10360 [Planctomycetota bacterium]|nr:hypothetical protein [Planctomycetota bacterium]